MDDELAGLVARTVPVVIEQDADRLLAVDGVETPGVVSPQALAARIERCIEVIEDLDSRIADLRAQRLAVLAAAKAHGVQVKALKHLVRRRAQEADGGTPLVQEAVNTAYLAALGEPLPLSAGESAEAVKAVAQQAVAALSVATVSRTQARLEAKLAFLDGPWAARRQTNT